MKKIILLAFLLCIAIFLSGCSTLSYIGEDYSPNNTQLVKTNEDFVFDSYKKSIGDVDIKIGVTKTPVQEILSLYVQVENYNYQNPYIFKVEDLRVSDESGTIPFITSNNYLSIWQNQESSSMSQMSAMSGTLATMTGMTSNYNDFNQGILQNAAQKSSESAFGHMEQMGNQLLKHSIKVSSTINPRKSQYFYFFFENRDQNITVTYKNLVYKFKI